MMDVTDLMELPPIHQNSMSQKRKKPISSSLMRATKEAEKAVPGRSSIARADDETGPFPR
jgi:hypothetical protein